MEKTLTENSSYDMTPLEYILSGPAGYLGLMDKEIQKLWVYENDKMVYRSISYFPALYIILDEILLDAAENKQRSPSMDSLKVSIDTSTNTISVYYNGKGIPVKIHPQTNVYFPELIYSNLNYKLDGSRYGHRAKLTNIFSTEFVIETTDGHKKYKQEFKEGMSKKSVPEVTECKAGENWTKVTFKPDLKVFEMNPLEEDIVGLMKKRVLDMAEFLGKTVKVELNDQLIRIIKSCDDLYMKSAEMSKPAKAAIELAFRKKKSKHKKTWIRKVEPGTIIDRRDKFINYKYFFNKEAKLFSRADLQRSIPSMVDGLKLDQRKILFCSFKKKLCKAINVGQFIGYVSEHSAYRHGKRSLASTIIGMAQDFVGSNNINLLKPNGQFGTRNLGGKDHASARHIYTELNPVTRCLFHEDDDKLLKYLNENGRSIEPNWYIPIIPLVLVNGSSERIGTGWSSYIANYNPREIIANVKHWLNGENMVPMQPWYRGFNGKIEESSKKKGEYIVSGKLDIVEELTTFKITELPIHKWTQDYMRFLKSKIPNKADGRKCLIEVSQNGDYPNLNIKIRLDPYFKEQKEIKERKEQDLSQNGDHANGNIKNSIESDKKALITEEELLKKFKLTTTISTNNMYLLDAEGKIKKFDNPEQILEEFIPLRLEYYQKRREYILANLKRLLFLLDNIVKFVLRVLKGKIKTNVTEEELLKELKMQCFTPMPRKGKSTSTGAIEDNSEALKDDYEYLLYLPHETVIAEIVWELLAEMNEKKKQFDVLKTTTAKSLWMKDLNELEKKLDEIYGKEEEEESERSSQAENVVKVTKPKGRAGSKKIQKDSADDDILCIQEFPEYLDAYNFKPSGEKTGALETEEPPVHDDDDFIPFWQLLDAYNFKPSGEKTGAWETDETTVVLDTASENEVGDVDNDDDDDGEVVQQPAPEASKKEGGRNLGTKITFGQMLLTDMLQPAEGTGTSSPEKKVRKMRESPFNKTSASILGRATNKDKSPSEDLSSGSGSAISGSILGRAANRDENQNEDLSSGSGSSKGCCILGRLANRDKSQNEDLSSGSGSSKSGSSGSGSATCFPLNFDAESDHDDSNDSNNNVEELSDFEEDED